MENWFTIDTIDPDTAILSEYRHWEETHCYLLTGTERALLIDTGLGICDISQPVRALTDKPVTAVATHIHWDHVGGHKYYPDFCAHEAELDWLERQPSLWPAFTLLWALKEARVKESGQGLTSSIRDIRVPLPEPGPLRLDDLWFRAWTSPGWAAAVCGHSEPPEKIFKKSLDIPTV